jgi:hypothetical protein
MNIKIKNHKNVIVESHTITRANGVDIMGSDDKDYTFKAILKNNSRKNLSELKYDLRFYDKDRKLLNIEKKKFIEDSEIKKDEDLVIFISYNLLEECDEIAFSCSARREFKTFKIFCISTFVLFCILTILPKIIKLFS